MSKRLIWNRCQEVVCFVLTRVQSGSEGGKCWKTEYAALGGSAGHFVWSVGADMVGSCSRVGTNQSSPLCAVGELTSSQKFTPNQ